METDLDIRIHKNNDIPVLVLSGDVDEFTCSKLREAMRTLVSEGEFRIAVNLSGVNYMDSSGLGTLVGGLRRVAEQEGALALYGPNIQIEKVLSITGLNAILEMFDGEDSAVRSLK